MPAPTKLTFNCPACKKRLSADPDLSGKKVKCSCGQKILVPESTSSPGPANKAKSAFAVMPVEQTPVAEHRLPLTPTRPPIDTEPEETDSEETLVHAVTVPRQSSFRLGMALGGMIFILGVFFTASYFLMDTSVAVDGGGFFPSGRVINLSLMDERRNGLMVSLAVAGLGVVLMVVNRRK